MEKLSQKRAPIYETLERFRRNRVVPFDVLGHKHGSWPRCLEADLTRELPACFPHTR